MFKVLNWFWAHEAVYFKKVQCLEYFEFGLMREWMRLLWIGMNSIPIVDRIQFTMSILENFI